MLVLQILMNARDQVTPVLRFVRILQEAICVIAPKVILEMAGKMVLVVKLGTQNWPFLLVITTLDHHYI